MSKLLETLEHDAAQAVESELPAIGDVRGLLVSLAHRLEAELPHLAERALEDVLAVVKPAGPAAPAAPADEAPIASGAAEPAPAAAAAPAAPSEPTGANVAPVESALDAELADARQRVIELEARSAVASQSAPDVTTSPADEAPIASSPASPDAPPASS